MVTPSDFCRQILILQANVKTTVWKYSLLDLKPIFSALARKKLKSKKYLENLSKHVYSEQSRYNNIFQ